MSRRRRADPDLCGVLLVDKPAGPTSHDVVGWVRWVLGVRRVGHCGTLDPAATGLLVVGVGPATKLAPYFTGQDKGYRARIVLGASTTTADADGEVIEQAPCPPDLEAHVEAAVRGLVGTHALPPPAFSAVHVDGRRAHALARAGQAPQLPPRPMTVHAVEPGAVRREGARVEAELTLLVSKGTYIRSLAEALGRALGMPAHLGALHRTRSGALTLTDPQAVHGLRAQPHQPQPDRERPPRWRIRVGPGDDPSRSAQAEVLRAHLVAPGQAVPLPVLRVRDDPSGQRALARLASGMALAWNDPGLASASGAEHGPEIGPEIGPDRAGPQRLAVVPADPGSPGLVVVQRQGSGAQARWAPERVVVPPPRGP
ncbi:MAG: tRNA pseudouridine(55) synthase TruB [Myxococcota bacterium]